VGCRIGYMGYIVRHGIAWVLHGMHGLHDPVQGGVWAAWVAWCCVGWCGDNMSCIVLHEVVLATLGPHVHMILHLVLRHV